MSGPRTATPPRRIAHDTGPAAVVIYGRAEGVAWAFHPAGPAVPALLGLQRRLEARGYRLVGPGLGAGWLDQFAAPDTPGPARTVAREFLGLLTRPRDVDTEAAPLTEG
jgi:hypothetical protein